MAQGRSLVHTIVKLVALLVTTIGVFCDCDLAHSAEGADYLSQVKPLLSRKCFSCHGALKQEADLRVDAAAFMIGPKDGDGVVAPGNPDESELLHRVRSADPDYRMPPEGEPLTHAEMELVERWIQQGASAPVDESPQADPSEHWAFQPLKAIDIPQSGYANPIDAFIGRRLAESNLKFAPEANPISLVRRLHLDMLGLPPTPHEVRSFQKDMSVDANRARQKRIDALLSSPHYGERWAQHWLDVVRYADTHGFEVNTPRNNAWPYRDYVIDSFNSDKPYDQFVREQLAGDQLGQDAATGFLVAAPVLLPGQIGKDDASKRLARQDALDEIIVGTSASFLGLTIGCARCHDHKFDPISQEDYYALQAFFAGVHYGERKHNHSGQAERERAASQLADQIDDLKEGLTVFDPIAFTGQTIIIDDEDSPNVTSLYTKNGHGSNPAGKERGYRDDVGDAQRSGNISQGRYTWWDNKPGVDAFTWNPSIKGHFRVWISWGVHGSGVHTRDARYVLDQDGDLGTTHDQQEIARADQYYFVGQSNGESKKTPLWSGLLDAGPHSFSPSTRLILRGGDTGTGITADVVVFQNEDEQPKNLPLLRGPVSPKKNVERFKPIDAKYIRFTTFATIDDNRHQPCIDELEVYSAGKMSKNVALATNGVLATSSGNYSETGKHQLKHVNDGQYGNSRSWISNEYGAGWVQLELPEVTSIHKVVWGRDRDSKFKDRLAVKYEITVSRDGEQWTTVASSSDRIPLDAPYDELISAIQRTPPEKSQTLAKDFDRLQMLERQHEKLRKPKMVYAGIFREAELTHVLHRGDPEQPKQITAPHTPGIVGSLQLPKDAPESKRRQALADWIAGPDNPLTARVMVNRIWQFHFGQGLVSTPSDFGVNGAKPSHPELLDWLANEFIRNGWSIKQMHRLILSSRTYRQSSHVDHQASAIDADCKLLWRYPSRRLEAEAIRDSILLVSGQLNFQAGGPGFNFFKTRGGLSGFPPVEEFTANESRRMIYSHKIRMEKVPVFGAFDCPDAGQAMPRRSQSTTAIQALNLFNSEFVNEQSQAFAKRLSDQIGSHGEQQVNRAFELAFGRRPTKVELDASLNAANKHGLETLCRVLFNCNEFLFIP